MAFKIYTKTGDTGETGLFGGKRLPKSHLRIEAYGTVDELNAHLGLLRDLLGNAQQRDILKQVQDNLFSLGASLATTPEKQLAVPSILPNDIETLEQQIDAMETVLPLLKNFILPGGHPTVSQCHIARCVCRRTERAVVALHLTEPVDAILIRYLNRLSDYLFVLSRKIAQDLQADEIVWQARK
jgi:cob(I)alamin adenosyltransferase